MRRKASATLLLMATLCSATGCADGPPAWESVSDTEVRDLTLPEAIEIERAEQKLIKQCMDGRHLPYWEFPVPSVDERKNGSFVIDDVRWAAKYGYGRVFDDLGAKIRSSHPTILFQNKLDRPARIAYSKAFEGDPDDRMEVKVPGGHGTLSYPRGGCTNEARGKLYGDAETWYKSSRTVENLLPLYSQDLRRDKRFTTALGRWARCMKAAGRPFDTPEKLREARQTAIQDMPVAKADAFDKKLAVTEATCAKQSSLAETARSLEEGYRAQAAKPYPKQWDDYRKMRLFALRQAREVLS
ncbi:hypothetical protein KV205_26565 [Streptomyces sp. SKN60]|uniref:hypothetical protein n=1 Tax=Streptomyces sp. SKN60 TaxID=2855506 RepID=UPI00224776C8|nr:hypothetical protein [Streptomyces sp. SKN60]MCX2184070.1 hypothetical protein [Streptomyces sp. SKN60]